MDNHSLNSYATGRKSSIARFLLPTFSCGAKMKALEMEHLNHAVIARTWVLLADPFSAAVPSSFSGDKIATAMFRCV